MASGEGLLLHGRTTGGASHHESPCHSSSSETDTTALCHRLSWRHTHTHIRGCQKLSPEFHMHMPPGIKFLTLVTSSRDRGTQSEQLETLKTPGGQSPAIPQDSEGTPQSASTVLRPKFCQPTSPSWLWSHVLVIWIVALKRSLQQGFQLLLPTGSVSEVPLFPLRPDL